MKPTNLWLDLETYSEVPISAGTYLYAEACEILLFAYAIDDEPARCVDLVNGEKLPEELTAGIHNASYVWAHNNMFDRNVILRRHPELAPLDNHWRDTMIQALEHSLPAGLGALCQALRLPTDKAKDKDGRALVRLFCQPRPKNCKARRATRDTHPEEWSRFMAYATQDVEAMRNAHNKMPKWNYPNNTREQEFYAIDRRVNDRGLLIDVPLVDAAMAMIKEEQALLRQQTGDLTAGALNTTTKRDKTIDYILQEHGILVDDLTKSTVTELLALPDLEPALRELLLLRQQASSASTAKYKKVRSCLSSDGRLRGTIQFCGASRTGRDAGRMFQPQNLPSRGLLSKPEISYGVDAVTHGFHRQFFDNTMLLATSLVRSIVIAPEGKLLYVCDLANIEGRMVSWLVGEYWKLEAFKAFDRKEGPDLYRLAYAQAFRVEHIDVDSFQRSIGKVFELMLGYQGGVGAFVVGALGYGFDIEALAEEVTPTLPPDVVTEAEDFHGWLTRTKRLNDYGLTKRAWIACEALKRLWRRSNPAVASSWKELENAAIKAVNEPMEVVPFRGRLLLRREGSWLRIKLPSGRSLCYPSIQYQEGSLSYMGVHQYTRKWSRIATSGGKLLENITQAASRDILFDALPTLEAEGYEVVLRVHDEIVAEGAKDLTLARMSTIMTSSSPWADGLPLAAAGFTSRRYGK